MSANTKIEWADHTFNPWIGCTKVSPACDNCYAEKSTPARTLGVNWGAGAERHLTSLANWKMPLLWEKNAAEFLAVHGRRQRVFCASLADVFDNAVPAQWRADLFKLIAATPSLDWLLLTKRIGNVADMVAVLETPRLPDNAWLGITVCNQAEADRDIPKLLAVPAAKQFLSVEPLLGPVDLTCLTVGEGEMNCLQPCTWGSEIENWRDTEDDWRESFEDWYGVSLADLDPAAPMHNKVDWVIVGGESGPGARPMHPDWARSLRDQCVTAGVSFLFKQWGEWIEPDIDGMPVRLTAREGDPEFFEAAAKVDGFLCADGRFASTVDELEDDVRYLGMRRVGKKAAGRQLDGRTWDEVPA